MRLHFNRSLRSNYSWLPKGINSQIVNLNVKGTWSIISAIWSNGEYFIQIVKSTINQEIFQEFIWMVYYCLKTILKNELENAVFILDNATIHSSLKTQKLFTLLKLNIDYLPPYSPKLAAIELLFNIIKNKIRSKYSDIAIDFWEESGRDWIYNSINDIKPFHLIQLWIQIIKHAKFWIIHFTYTFWRN